MNDDGWIVIPNWDRFQHYTDRDPIWIKVYTELVHNDEFLNLSLSDRGLLVTLWVLYARSLGQLRVPRVREFLPPRYPARHFLGSLRSLSDAGFVEVSASKPLALARSREKRREEKNEPASKSEPNRRARSTNSQASGEDFGTSDETVKDEMLRLARGWLREHGVAQPERWEPTEEEPF